MPLMCGFAAAEAVRLCRSPSHLEVMPCRVQDIIPFPFPTRYVPTDSLTIPSGTGWVQPGHSGLGCEMVLILGSPGLHF